MQYISIDTNDLKSENNIFRLSRRGDTISFSVFSGDVALGADEGGKREDSYLNGYFLRKRFSSAIRKIDSDVIEPIYKTTDGKSFSPESIDEAINMIYHHELTVSGFRFKENVEDEQKDEEFGKLIDSFVMASRNLDLRSVDNLFEVVDHDNYSEVAYNNGGSESMEIDGTDVQEKLGLNTLSVVRKREMEETQNSLNLKRDFADVKSGTNEEKLDFIRRYGFLFDSNQMDESIISKKTYGELSAFVKDTFKANKDKFKDDRRLFIDGISILERSNLFVDQKVRSGNAMTLVDMFKHCGDREGSTLEYSILSCRTVNAEVVHYALNNYDLSQWAKDSLLGKMPWVIITSKNENTEIKQRLERKKKAMRAESVRLKEDKVSGVVVADKIAEAQINGVIYEPVTPEKGKALSESIKNRMMAQKLLKYR